MLTAEQIEKRRVAILEAIKSGKLNFPNIDPNEVIIFGSGDHKVNAALKKQLRETQEVLDGTDALLTLAYGLATAGKNLNALTLEQAEDFVILKNYMEEIGETEDE